jgi:ubiquinone/menaquinone biosynthesis C-methylase UbiE
MGFLKKLSLRAFGRPKGLLGKIGGKIMAHMNQHMTEEAIKLMDIQPDDYVLEVGFGPGTSIKLLSDTISSGWIAGIDPSEEMIRQAKTRNSSLIKAGKVDLRKDSVENLPFDSSTFEKAMSINSFPFCPDAVEGLREIRRTLKPGRTIVLGFTYHSGQKKENLPKILEEVEFKDIYLTEGEEYFFMRAQKEQ